MVIFFAILKNEKIGFLAASAIAILIFTTNPLQIDATSNIILNVVVAKGQNVHSSGHRAAKDACFTVLRMAEKTATQK
jgi:hypothetical protein